MNHDFHNDPVNWKFGIFYFHPEDKRLLVPKRFSGSGFTLNFANPYSFLVIGAIVIFVGAIS